MEMTQEKKMTDEFLERLKKKIDSLDDIVITEDGEILRFPPNSTGIVDVINSLRGIIKGNYNLDEVKEEYLREKYDLVH